MISKYNKFLMLVVVLVMIFILQSENVTAETAKHLLSYRGNDYKIEISFTEESGISENAVLNVKEIVEGSIEYQKFYTQTDEFVNQEEIEVHEKGNGEQEITNTSRKENKDSKDRMSLVAFENESVILNDWTKDSDEILKNVNFKTDSEMPLYNGEGINYESALAKEHEALSKTGYSGNAKEI